MWALIFERERVYVCMFLTSCLVFTKFGMNVVSLEVIMFVIRFNVL